jgi:thiol-disulfide isomerase/thioredoxin
MLERLFLAVVFIAFGTAIWIAFNRWSVARARKQAPTDPLLQHLKYGVPAILYFTTPDCQPCRTIQKPALHKLEKALGPDAIQIVQIDATEEPEAADRWGVFSAPTTFILDHSLRPYQINRGVASYETLRRQVAEALPG